MSSLYSVNFKGKPMACGTLAECWQHLMNVFGRDARIMDVADFGVTIEPAPLATRFGLMRASCQ